MRRRRFLCLAAATLALAAPSAGQAAPPQELDTSPTGGEAPATARAESGKKLPFSGLDLALLTAGGGPLLLIGVSLRRRRPAAKVKPAQEDLAHARVAG
jgi:hypothetical protein